MYLKDAVPPVPPHLARTYLMDYSKKINKMEEHLKSHPGDYQTQISLLKVRSDAYQNRMYQRRIYRMKRLAEVKKQLKGEQNEE